MGAEVEAVVEVEVAVAEVSIRERGDIDQLFYLLSNTKVTPSLGCKEGRDGLKPFLDFRPFSFFFDTISCNTFPFDKDYELVISTMYALTGLVIQNSRTGLI